MMKEVRPKYQISKMMVGGASVCRSKKSSESEEDENQSVVKEWVI
jgi:hypothetical protein